MDEASGPVWIAREVQSLAIPARNSSQDPVATPHLRSANLDCGNLREEGQQPPQKMAGASKKSKQHCTLWAPQLTATATQVLGRGDQGNERKGSVAV